MTDPRFDQLAIVIVNWNGPDDTIACLDSLAQTPLPPERVVLVDNGSTDDSVARIAAAHPRVTLLPTGRNLGFTGGNNLGIAHARQPGVRYVMLLNNDTVLGPAMLERLLDAAERHPRFGVLTPEIRYHDEPEAVWFDGARLDLARGLAVHDRPAATVGGGIEPLPWTSGCAMLIRDEVLEQCGGFDDRFFLNWEDVDLSLRVVAAGWELGLVRGAVLYHKVGRSFARVSGLGLYYHARNQWLLLRLHGGAGRRRAAARVLARRVRETLRLLRHRPGTFVGAARWTARAGWDHARGRYGPIATGGAR
ncbi:MAG: glycosyltransferase family 2 protein [Planctomycetota bacterium]